MRIIRGPYLQDPQKDSMIIRWETDEETSGKVVIYETYKPHVPRGYAIQGEPKSFSSEVGTMHSVRVEYLEAGQDYYYEVILEKNGESIVSEKYSLRTAPLEDAAFSFVVTAENGGCDGAHGPYMKPIIENIESEHPDFLLSVGDIVWNGLDEADWDVHFFDPFAKLLRDTPFYPCIGNHEVCSVDVKEEEQEWRYRYCDKYFAFRSYYSFDYGCAHFCVLDCPSMALTFESKEDDLCSGSLNADFEKSEQYRFLEEDLAVSKAKWKFVIFHFPMYTSAIYDVRELQVLAPVFEKYGVDIVFNSHAIVYERSHPIKEGKVAKDGVRYVLAGGYHYRDWFRNKSNQLSARLVVRPNYVRVTLSPYIMELDAIDYEGKLFDKLVLEKE